MWIFLKNSFLSIIDPEGAYDGSDGPVGKRLLVRRDAGPLAIVVDELSISTTEIFAGGMQALGRSTRSRLPTLGAGRPRRNSHARWRVCWRIAARQTQHRAMRTMSFCNKHSWHHKYK